jgi:hypothetical protein
LQRFYNRDDVVYASGAGDCAPSAANAGFESVRVVEPMQFVLIPVLESIDWSRSEVEIACHLRE